VNKKLKKVWKQVVMPNLMYYLGICLESQTPQSGQMLLDQDFNAGPLEKECPIHYSLLGIQCNEVVKLLMFERNLPPHSSALITWAAGASKTSV
jgi:hypothetical protein